MVAAGSGRHSPVALGAAGFAMAVIGFLVLYGAGVFSVAGASAGDSRQPTPTPGIQVPDVVGLPGSDARQRLESLGLRVETTFVFGIGRPGFVTAQHAVEAAAEPGDRVTLTIARSVARVPDVVGMSRRAAGNEVERYGYRVIIRRVAASSDEAGQVLSTLPSAGTRQRPQTAVVLRLAVLSRCDPNYTGYCVPNVSYDLNCADIGHMVHIVGVDRFGFDGDGNGWGCEAYG
jgi:beta-lactam-binding protein with PASTA domain